MEEFQLLQQVLSQCRELKEELAELKRAAICKEMLTLDEFCKYSGLSKASAYKITASGKIKHYKPMGRLLFFKKSEVDEFLSSNPVSTVAINEGKSLDYLITQPSKKKRSLKVKK
ncbi:MAG: helix-turn-helix domain-containing protein [Taibaiella sp.]|jgi:excisionase family DNA binding protein